MRYREILEDYPVTDEFRKEFIAHLADYFGRHEDDGWVIDEYDYWYRDLSNLHDHGGKVYRVVFVNDISEVRTDDLGRHWSTRELDDSALERLRNDAQHEMHMTDRSLRWAKCIQITAQIPARNVTIEGVNLPEEWTEYEVNLLDPTKITITDIREIDG